MPIVHRNKWHLWINYQTFDAKANERRKCVLLRSPDADTADERRKCVLLRSPDVDTADELHRLHSKGKYNMTNRRGKNDMSQWQL